MLASRKPTNFKIVSPKTVAVMIKDFPLVAGRLGVPGTAPHWRHVDKRKAGAKAVYMQVKPNVRLYFRSSFANVSAAGWGVPG